MSEMDRATKNQLATILRKSRDNGDENYRFKQYDQVRNYVENYNSLVARDKANQRYSTAVALQKERLTNLLEVLHTNEQEIYHLFNVKDLPGLQAKIAKWNASGASYLLSEAATTYTTNRLRLYVNDQDIIDTINQYLAETPTNPTQGTVAHFVNSLFEDASHALFQDNKSKNGKLPTGINGQLTWVADPVTGRITVEKINADRALTPLFVRFAAMINEKGDPRHQIEIQSNDWNEVKDDIFDALVANITDAAARKWIEYELKDRTANYAKFGTRYVVQGWLGEVYWNAALDYLLDRPATVPTGKIRNQQGHQLSVDIVFNDLLCTGAGIQVKNWSSANQLWESELNQPVSHVTNYNNKLFGNFLANRAQMLDTAIGKTIAEMFGAYTYNRPNLEYGADLPVRDLEPYSTFYDRAFTNLLVDAPNKLTPIIGQFLDRIIGIDREEITGDNDLVGAGRTFHNTLWAIGDTLIPSSAIIEEMITQLESNTTPNLVSFQIQAINEKTSSPTWPDRTNLGLAQITNRFSIDYSVTFNLTTLLQKVYNRMK